jgi:Zn-dependent peptidase ImmA (M78 family)
MESSSEKYRHSIEEVAFDYVERYSEIEQILGLETSRQNSIEDLLIQVPDDVESAAEQLRKEWHLGEDPLASTVEISEGKRVKVVEVDSPKEFDGLSGQANSRPVIVLAKWLKDDLSRKRLTILHEIGHLLLWFSSAIDEKTEEKICYRFAGAMLIPRKVFEKEFGGVRRQVWLEELLDIKLRYGISLAAIVQRALDLKLIGQDQYRIFQKYRSARGWRKDEPGSYVGREFSSRFEQLVLRAAAEEYISLSKAASLLKKSLSEIKSILTAVA